MNKKFKSTIAAAGIVFLSYAGISCQQQTNPAKMSPAAFSNYIKQKNEEAEKLRGPEYLKQKKLNDARMQQINQKKDEAKKLRGPEYLRQKKLDAARVQSEKFGELEGKIIKVQPSSISYFGPQQQFMAYQGDTGTEHPQTIRSSSNHEFLYVFIEDKIANLHLLIQPSTRGILETPATIKYEVLPNGSIGSTDFVRKYINQNYGTEDTLTITAEGVILKDGIAYKRQNKPVAEKP